MSSGELKWGEQLAGYRRDYLLITCAAISAVLFVLAAAGFVGMTTSLGRAAHAVHEMLGVMWWGILIAIVVIGVLDRIPQAYVLSLLGPPGSRVGVMRAAIAGVLLDLCSHGILMVGAKLYEKGASAGQVMAFLIASPWNSVSLTVILIGLLGLGWTLTFILLSLVVAVTTGLIFERLAAGGRIPANPHPTEIDTDVRWRQLASEFDWSPGALAELIVRGLRGSRIVLRWLAFGLVAAALLRALLTAEDFAQWFGPSLLGLSLTLLGAAVFEVCSEGSVPIAADLMNRAQAPGNSFTFLLAGVATDYTEVMVLKEATTSWKIALLLPAITVPQVLVLGYLLNALS